LINPIACDNAYSGEIEIETSVRSNPRRGHHPPPDLIVADDLKTLAVKHAELLAQSGAGVMCRKKAGYLAPFQNGGALPRLR